MDDLENLEARLRQFRPRRPAAIPDERLQRLRGPIWLGVAAGIAATMFIASRLHAPAPPQRMDPTLGALTAVAVEHPDDLDNVLAALSRTTLPDVTRPGAAFRELSKEF